MSPQSLHARSDRRNASVRRLSISWPGAALALAVVSVPVHATAQDAAALATRRELIAEAQTARNGGNHQQALDLAQRASQIQNSPSLRLFVAQEQNALGRLAEAYGNADLCMREADADTSMRNREQVSSTCRALAAELRARIARVVVQVPSPAPNGLEVRVAGAPLASTLWGAPYVVTPGAVAIDATAAGYRPFHTEVTPAPGATTDVRIALEPAGETGSSEPPSSGAPVATPGGGSGGVPIAPLVVTGVGVVVLALAPVFYFGLRASEIHQAETICPGFNCGSQTNLDAAQRHLNTASTWSTLTWVSVGVGGAAIVGGLVWFFVARSHNPNAAPARAWNVMPIQGGAMVGVQGTF